MENLIAKFKVTSTLLVSNKLNLVGSLLEGNFSEGNYVLFEKDEKVLKRKILGLGTVSNIDRKLIWTLRIECKNKIEKESLKNWNPNSVIVNIISQ